MSKKKESERMKYLKQAFADVKKGMSWEAFTKKYSSHPCYDRDDKLMLTNFK